MKKIINSKKGFTLIELLIVVAIIGVLATLLMANFVGVRQRARDAQRKSDVRQMQAALEIYRSDNGTYPAVGSGAGNLSTNASCKSSLTDSSGNSTYMKSIPCDPNGGSYTYLGGGVGYSLVSCLENASDSQADSPKNAGCSTASYTITNP